MIRMIRMIWPNHPTHPGRRSSTRTSGSRSGSSAGPGIAKHYIFHCFCARLGIALLSQRSLKRSPSEAQMCDFPWKFQWLAQYRAPDCSHSHIGGAGRSRIIQRIILLAFQAYPWPSARPHAEVHWKRCYLESLIISGILTSFLI